MFEILDPRFRKIRAPIARLEKLYTGAQFCEGAVYFADLRCVLFSDIPNSRIMRWDEDSGQTSVFRSNQSFSNGNTRDLQGRLITCEQGARRVTRTELNGSITVLADKFDGKKLNSPNDVVVKSDGSIWFTDPTYGISSYFEGGKAESEIGKRNVYRLDPATGKLVVAVDDFAQPNGLVFSPDESLLYIVDSGIAPDPNGPHHIRRFQVTEKGKLRGGEVLVEVAPGIPDGLRVDTEGNLWCTAEDGVHCFTKEGELIGKVLVPEVSANVVFGGPLRNRLFICATSSLYAIYTNVQGAQVP
jgi:gluconolactonase